MLQEIILRGAIAVAVLAYHEITRLGSGGGDSSVRALVVIALGLNALYYLTSRGGRWPHVHDYARMLLDIAVITAGLAGVGGLAAAPYLGLYALVTVYAGLVFSSRACLVATGAATAGYLMVVLIQHTGASSALHAASPGWGAAALSLLLLNSVSGLTAMLTATSTRRQARLGQEIERAHDHALRFNTEMQHGAWLSVMGEVVAGVTHELGNVLTVAAGHVGLARRKAGRSAEIDEHLLQIDQSLEVAMRIIRGTLHTARTAAVRTTIAIPELAGRILELKAYDLRRAGVTARADFPAGFPAVSATPYQIQQVLLNLVANAEQALRAAPGPRVLEIVGRIGQGQVIVEVRDTGPGLDAQALPRIFEPFYTSSPERLGLGLAIAAGIVHGLEGTLTAENRPGGGALFRMTLPTETAMPAPALASPTASTASH